MKLRLRKTRRLKKQRLTKMSLDKAVVELTKELIRLGVNVKDAEYWGEMMYKNWKGLQITFTSDFVIWRAECVKKLLDSRQDD